MLLSTEDYEEKFWPEHTWVCGIDEAGRGPLAGPVVAAAVMFPRYFKPEGVLTGLNDSKSLRPKQRSALAEAIQSAAECFSISIIDHATIDRVNIFNATMLAMNAAAEKLEQLPGLLLIDGNRFVPSLPMPYLTIVKGDAKVVSIAAASILAKTCRDRIMNEYHREYPEYGFAQHFGYPTQAHIAAIARYGRCPIHRTSFRVKQLGEK
ncbi:MAG: ribonuclease HII [Chlorobium phaeobacteroides]|nr:ribonuclease HII [Chlorobium phaeobacteroides]